MNDFLDSNVRDNFKVLPAFLEGLKTERDKLKRQLLGLDFDGSDDNDWEKVASEARKTVADLEEIQKHCEIVIQEVKQQEESRVSTKGIGELLSKLQELDEAEKVRKYLLWIKRTHLLSNDISSQLSSGNTSKAITLFSQLSDMATDLSSSSCSQLKELVRNTCEEQRVKLKDMLSSQYADLLNIIGWPLTSASTIKAKDAWTRKQSEFSSCFKNLIIVDQAQYEYSQTHIPDLDAPLLLPIELLVTPLRKRFRYHFYGDRKTNSREKPEWFFTQVSQWITDHTHFLENSIQPHLAATQYKHLDVKVEFIRGLLQELTEKIRHELNPSNHPTINNDYLFSHLIDELLLFDKEVCSLHSYPTLYPKCIKVLLEENVLCRWRNLEKHFAVEKLKAITESPSVWEPAYALVVGDDDTHVPECAERFMQLIAGITERYRQIPTTLLRLQFLELQNDLLLEFSKDLSLAIKNSSSSPLSDRYIAYLNASNYIGSLLKCWGEETFFLELHYYYRHVNTNAPRSFQEETLAQVEALRRVDPDFADVEGTVFDNVAEVFETFCDEMIDTMTTQCVKDLRSKCSGYKKERWHNLPTVADPGLLELSPSALGFLVHIQHLLHSLKTSVAPLVQDKLFHRLISKLDALLLDQIICSNKFSRGGADQIHYDITQVIKPLVADCLKETYSPSAILKRTCEACCLLKQPSSFIDLLQSLLQLSLSGNDDSAYQEVTALLKEKEILSLSLEEALQLTTLIVD